MTNDIISGFMATGTKVNVSRMVCGAPVRQPRLDIPLPDPGIKPITETAIDQEDKLA
jgi:hypothetical protein